METLCPQPGDERLQEIQSADEEAGALLTQPVMPEGWEKSPLWQLQQAVMQNAASSDGGGETLAADEISTGKAHNPLPALPLSLNVNDRQDGAAPCYCQTPIRWRLNRSLLPLCCGKPV